MGTHNWNPVSRGLLWSDSQPIDRTINDAGTAYAENVNAGMRGWDSDNLVARRIRVNSSGELVLADVALDTGDLSIGAVEIKNSTDDTRATVGSDGLYVDVRASALPSGASTSTKQDLQATAAHQVTAQTTLTSLATYLDGLSTNAETQPVSLASVPTHAVTASGAFPVTDNSGTLTVDAPVGTPVFVRLSDGSSPISTLPVSGPLTDAQLRALAVPVSGTVTASGPLTDAQLRAAPVPVKETRSATGTGSTASISTSATVLASNANRLGATIFNESGGACLVKLGSTASATDYTVNMAIGGYYEVPFGYTGGITGIAVSGTATLRVVELT